MKKNDTISQSFTDIKSFDEKQLLVSKIMRLYPHAIPIIIERDQKSQLPDLDQNKYIMPYNSTIIQLISIIRNKIQLKPELALLIFSGDNVLPINQTMLEIHNQYAEKDGFLFIKYHGERIFDQEEPWSLDNY